MARPKNLELREYLLRNIPFHKHDIGPVTAQLFGVSRASVAGYLKALVNDGLVTASGRTNARVYDLATLDSYDELVMLVPGVEEDVILRDRLFPHLKELPENIRRICEYGFTEIMNNAIDHSEGAWCSIEYRRNYSQLTLTLSDNGVGIFDKIARECHLTDGHEAILELSKGKLTTDSSRHSGEGIFFTSRMFDEFSILSGDLCYVRTKQENDEWLIESATKEEPMKGTSVRMIVATNATQTPKEIFDAYIDDDARFSKTHVPLRLARYEGENLVSRSQARRLLSRVERFSEVVLDFKGVEQIGQAFADEIFRVWRREHPAISIVPINESADVAKMIHHAMVNAADDEAHPEHR